MNNNKRSALENERDFLIKSIENLESEFAVGNIDANSYQALHDDYTARAGAVLRSLRSGEEINKEPVSSRRRGLTIGAVVLFVVIAGLSLAFALGARLPGQTATGNSEPSEETKVTAGDRQRRLEAAIVADPNDVAARLLLAQYLEAQGDLAAALAQYDAVLVIDPNNAPALAQSGRILYLTAGQAPAADAAGLVNKASARLDSSLTSNPDYSEARFFRAIIRANEFGDFVGAQSDLQRYLVAEPNGRFADQARQLLTDVTNTLESTSPTTAGG